MAGRTRNFSRPGRIRVRVVLPPRLDAGRNRFSLAVPALASGQKSARPGAGTASALAARRPDRVPSLEPAHYPVRNFPGSTRPLFDAARGLLGRDPAARRQRGYRSADRRATLPWLIPGCVTAGTATVAGKSFERGDFFHRPFPQGAGPNRHDGSLVFRLCFVVAFVRPIPRADVGPRWLYHFVCDRDRPWARPARHAIALVVDRFAHGLDPGERSVRKNRAAGNRRVAVDREEFAGRAGAVGRVPSDLGAAQGVVKICRHSRYLNFFTL